ncbi:putative benzoate 4-monooxygenase cytochrome P450 [Astrocystis sublimbata]|nr:putative benzoate 4-monooxygenase cytochrome P450 [Astrocystis sublimbata]
MIGLAAVNVQAGLVLLALLLFAGVARLCHTRWRLRHIPGPFLASFTNFQRFYWVTTKQAHVKLQDAHEKHGEVVRIGPNMVSISNPEAIPTVYTTKPGFPKSEFYVTLRPYTRGTGALHAVFNTTDEAILKQIKPPIAPMFSVTNANSFEPLVDRVLECMHENLDRRFVETSEICNLGQWLQYFAFDVMGTLTFSKRYGFLDSGSDANGMLSTIIDFMRASAPMTQIPWLDKITRKNLLADKIRQLFGRTASLSILSFVAEAIAEKRELLKAQRSNSKLAVDGEKDFLTRFIELQENSPEKIPSWAPTAWTFSNVIAGSDSVGTIMRTIMYNLLAYPATLERLHAELSSADLPVPFPPYSMLRNLPYLDACVQEGFRMHPPFALPFERVVPEGGITVLGTYLPEGTVVGGNPYVVNRHKGTFGNDAEFWRPERWLVKDAARRKAMEQGVLTLGAGRRVCLGRHVGVLEIKKLIPFLLLNYKITIVDREKFSVENSWFFIQTGLYAQLEKPRPSCNE